MNVVYDTTLPQLRCNVVVTVCVLAGHTPIYAAPYRGGGGGAIVNSLRPVIQILTVNRVVICLYFRVFNEFYVIELESSNYIYLKNTKYLYFIVYSQISLSGKCSATYNKYSSKTNTNIRMPKRSG